VETVFGLALFKAQNAQERKNKVNTPSPRREKLDGR